MKCVHCSVKATAYFWRTDIDEDRPMCSFHIDQARGRAKYDLVDFRVISIPVTISL